MQTHTEKNQTIDCLSSFLRGELSAVETYRSALEKIQTASMRTQLQDCLQSHESRVELLRNRIATLGGSPPTSSGIWGTFAKLYEGGAKTFGEHAAINALEQGEDHGRDDYRRELDKLDADTRRWVEMQLLPAQLRTHSIVSALKKTQH